MIKKVVLLEKNHQGHGSIFVKEIDSYKVRTGLKVSEPFEKEVLQIHRSEERGLLNYTINFLNMSFIEICYILVGFKMKTFRK